MTLITEEYLKQNKKLHETTEYGTSGYRYAYLIDHIIKLNNLDSVLDYGAGKCTLEKELIRIGTQAKIISYEPTNNKLSTKIPCDLLACLDVLEHIEPSNLDDVLFDLSKLSKHIAVFSIPTGPAGVKLSDGRNAHLIQEGLNYWICELSKYFQVLYVNNLTETIVMVAKKREPTDELFQEIEFEILGIAKKEILKGFYFDGLDLNIIIKKKKIITRIIVLLLKIVRLGKKAGIYKQIEPIGKKIRRINVIEI